LIENQHLELGAFFNQQSAIINQQSTINKQQSIRASCGLPIT
jgi:hypothetical protein